MKARAIGMLAAAVLGGLGGLHVYWAAGGKWGTQVTIPKRDGAPLFTPGPLATVLVAVLLCAAALVLLGRIGVWGGWLPRWPFVAGTWTLVVVFAGRAVGDFQWFGLFKRMTGTPFAWWDTWLYVPLCALLALAALLVAFAEP
jgi:Protein of unknown function (DUF3995)